MTEFELEELSAEIGRFKAEVAELERKAAHPSENDRLHLFRPQAQQVTNRKKDQMQRLQLLQEERDRVDDALKQQTDLLNQLGEDKVLTGEDFAAYAKQLRTKYAQCQKLKTEENEIKSELTVLNRTVLILKSRAGNVEEAMRKMEMERGIQGYRNQQEDIAKVSEQQEDVNVKKQASLEELSAIVLELKQKIQTQKLKLKEPIRELKYVLRPKYKELVEEYKEKKNQYEATKFQHEGEISHLRNDVTELEDSCNDLESRWHQLNAQISILSVHSARLSNRLEMTDQDGRKVSSYRELYDSRIKHAELESKKLRDVTKQVKLMYQPAKEQMQLFENLRLLLDCKRTCLSNDGNSMMGGEDGGHAVAHMSENVMQLE
jgi:chromosome segregation ATPase